MARKLTLEERDTLAHLLEQPGFTIVLRELVDLAQDARDRVLKFNTDAADAQALLRVKCRSEGADAMLAAFKARIEAVLKNSP